jgi:hypothetical protein
MVSTELQHATHDILARAKTSHADGIDSEDILNIGTLFGSLNDVQLRLTRQHQRRLLLQILTLQHLVPIWDQLLPGNHKLQHDLDSILTLVMKRLSPEQAQVKLDQLWEDIDAYPHAPPAIEHIGVSMYTTLKVIDIIENPKSSFDDYAPDTHAGVALWYSAQVYVAYQSIDQHDEHHYYQQYWNYWLTEIVPRAWFALPEDTTNL